MTCVLIALLCPKLDHKATLMPMGLKTSDYPSTHTAASGTLNGQCGIINRIDVDLRLLLHLFTSPATLAGTSRWLWACHRVSAENIRSGSATDTTVSPCGTAPSKLRAFMQALTIMELQKQTTHAGKSPACAVPDVASM